MVFAETEELQFGTVGEIAPHLIPVVTEQALAVGDEPQAPFLVFDHRVNGMEVGQLATHLLGVALVDELHHTKTRGSCEHIAVSTFKEAGGITAALLTLEVGHRHIIEVAAVPGL